MGEISGQLVLAQNQFAFIQDSTKGTVQVYAGPHALALSGNDKPVIYNKDKDEFVSVSLQEAIRQNPLVPEGHYLVLENPAFNTDGTLNPPKGGPNGTTSLQVGRKINIPGPYTFPLWPGQHALSIPGHHLHSNQYLVIRVYNADQANKNPIETDKEKTTSYSNGQLLVITGTKVPFFIPPTGFEVMQENGSYVREALTLERLEYCILLGEDGNKRFEKGPKVVFPDATERFMTKKDNDQGASNRKFKAIELNDQMGLYLKVIADYEEEDGTERKTGEELFVTGKEQRIYYPRPEHALIEYKDPKGFNRQRYYGIAIPKGEGRYALVKDRGDVKTAKGPQIYLPDPRNEVIVRRVLDDKTVRLWYPGNQEALDFNENLRDLIDDSASDNYIADSVVRSASVDRDRSMNRLTKGSRTLGAAPASFEGDKLNRGTQFTPPPTVTLNTKYDGVPTINPYVGYAVQVVDRSGNRRVVVGPATILLEYDESLAVLELSSGKPKTTDKPIRDVYLRVDNNIVSDIVRIETKDLVNVDIKLSYRVNFLREHQDKWFSVENYVKYLCDHMRSILKGTIKSMGVKEFIEGSTAVVRNVILGVKEDGKRRARFFAENGMEIYDVEVLGTTIADDKISTLLVTAQRDAVQNAITLSAEEQNLENTKRRVQLRKEVAELENSLEIKKVDLADLLAERKAEATMGALETEIAEKVAGLNAQVAEQEQHDVVAESRLERRKADENFTLELEAKRSDLSVKVFEAFKPDLIAAMYALGQSKFATELSVALAPLAIHEQQGLGKMLEKVFAGTGVAKILDNLQQPAKGATNS